MLTHLKAWSFVKRNAIHKCVKTLWIDERDANGKQNIHLTCTQNMKQDDSSKMDMVYQKCAQSHPQYYFNNLGLVHMKLKKYSMAIFYFSKAVKYLEKSNDKNIQQPNLAKANKINPNEQISNSTSQKTQEIVFNYGLALFKSEKYYEAFKCFEKVSLGVLKKNPKLWYYMSLCALKLNKQIYLELEGSESHTYHSKIGFSAPNYVRSSQTEQTTRFMMAPKGDPISNMENAIKDYEQNKIKEQKKVFVEYQKQINQEQIQQMSKTKAKKFETQVLQNFQQINSVSGTSLSLDNAIMYMQNVLSVIEHKIQNEIRYSLYMKQTVGMQIGLLDLTQQTFYQEIKQFSQKSAHFGNKLKFNQGLVQPGSTEELEKADQQEQKASIEQHDSGKNSGEIQNTKEKIIEAPSRQQVPQN